MRSIAYPEGWFYVERASVIMFGLQAQLAPKLNGIQVGFPYVMQFMMEKNTKRLADAVKPAATEAKPGEPVSSRRTTKRCSTDHSSVLGAQVDTPAPSTKYWRFCSTTEYVPVARSIVRTVELRVPLACVVTNT